MVRTKKDTAPLTTSQQLGSLLKTARDIMRKDKGLNGDLDRLPMLTWIMFLKFLDDMEMQGEDAAVMSGKKFKPAIEEPYRWRDWAATETPTGEDLIKFINQDEIKVPTSKKDKKGRPVLKRIPGLFAYLRKLTSADGDDRRDVIARVFQGVDNRMKSGYLLRDVINKVHGIHFTSSSELSTLGTLYESMLREMRDAAGDSGEFYTPRPVVRFMVKMTDPQLGELVLDPACGTGGFLTESYEHLKKQAVTAPQYRILQDRSLRGGEAKSLPYLLAQMNLLLHGLNSPQIDPGNSLGRKLTEIGDADRVEVILTNPPFGGEEEKGIQDNFPDDRKVAETTLLFLQLIMRKLRRKEGKFGAARAAVVVPNPTLVDGGVCARIKEELLQDFDLHTIVRLPDGVFAPYTGIPTNILFFERSGSTKDVWFYEINPPVGRKNFTKTRPIQDEDFAQCATWWHNREENERAWKVSAADLLSDNCNLDQRNPRGDADLSGLPAEALLTSIAAKGQALLDTLAEIQDLLSRVEEESIAKCGSQEWERVKLGNCIRLVDESVEVVSDRAYPNFGMYSYGKGLFEKPDIQGFATTAKTLRRVSAGQFIYSRLFAFEGAYGMVPPEFDGYFVSNEYPTFQCDPKLIRVKFLSAYFRVPSVWKRVAKGSTGLGSRRQRVQPVQILDHLVPLPTLEWQDIIINLQDRIDSLRLPQEVMAFQLNTLLPAILEKAFQAEDHRKGRLEESAILKSVRAIHLAAEPQPADLTKTAK